MIVGPLVAIGRELLLDSTPSQRNEVHSTRLAVLRWSGLYRAFNWKTGETPTVGFEGAAGAEPQHAAGAKRFSYETI